MSKFRVTKAPTQELAWDLDNEVVSHKTTVPKGKLHVTLDYNSGQVDIGDFLRESVAATHKIPDGYEDLERVSYMYYHLVRYRHTFWPGTLIAGTCLSTAETLRKAPEFRDTGIGELRKNHCTGCGQPRNRVFMPGERQPELGEKAVWGEEETRAETKSVPVREQVAKQKADLIDRTRSEAVPAEVELTAEGPALALEAKWKQAEKIARGPREAWEGKCDIEFEAMVKYCYGWLRDIGEIPEPMPSLLDLFWQKPLPYHKIKLDPKTVARRSYMSGRVMKFWRKSLEQEGMRGKLEIGRKPASYRVVLAAMKLAKAIELYAENWEPDPIHGDDEEVAQTVRTAALRYFEAHYPIDTVGAKPGPLATTDPPYAEYLSIVRKYGLREGVLLHRVDLSTT